MRLQELSSENENVLFPANEDNEADTIIFTCLEKKQNILDTAWPVTFKSFPFPSAQWEEIQSKANPTKLQTAKPRQKLQTECKRYLSFVTDMVLSSDVYVDLRGRIRTESDVARWNETWPDKKKTKIKLNQEV